jgi:hypothetical protein
MQSWEDCITGTHESSFWKRQGPLASVGQLLSHLAIDLSLGIHEMNEISLSHRCCSEFVGLISRLAKNLQSLRSG